MLVRLLSVFSFLLTLPLFGQFSDGDARSIGMGSAGVSFTDIHSIWHNPAGMAHIEGIALSGYGQQHYLLESLQTVGLGAVYPTNSGTLGLTLNYLGFDLYKEQRIGLGYSRLLTRNLSLGAQFLVLNTQIPEYGNKSLFTFEVGSIYKVLPQVWIGAHIYSPVRIAITEEENVPTLFSLGASYKPSNQVILSAEVEKDIDFDAQVKIGVEYQIIEALALRTGITTKPTTINFGVGYMLESGFAINAATRYHQTLGFTPGIGLVYQMNGKNN